MDLYNITGFLIHRTDVKLTNYFTKQLKPYKVTPEQWSIISCLDIDKAMTQKEPGGGHRSGSNNGSENDTFFRTQGHGSTYCS